MKEKKIDPEIRQLLKEDYIKYRTAIFLQGLSKDDRAPLFRLFKEIKLGTNKQREIVEWVFDIIKRDNIEAGEILSRMGFEEILDDPVLNAPQKGDRFRDRLFSMRYPDISRYLEGLTAKLRSLELPKNVKVVPMTPLEEGEFRMEIIFHSKDDLKESIDIVNNLIKNHSLKELWE